MHPRMWTERVTDVVKGIFFCLSSTLLDCIAAEIDFMILRDKVCTQLQELSDIHSEGGHYRTKHNLTILILLFSNSMTLHVKD